jgi:hypothetical protein
MVLIPITSWKLALKLLPGPYAKRWKLIPVELVLCPAVKGCWKGLAAEIK